MNFKKSRQEVLDQIKANSSAAIYNHLNNSLGSSIKVDAGSMVYVLQEAISRAITAGFQTMLENEYSDEDFEKDITLKP